MRCVCALCSAEYAIADFVFSIVCGGGGCRNGGDCTGEFGAADPGEGWLVLVFSLDLEDVEEICSC